MILLTYMIFILMNFINCLLIVRFNFIQHWQLKKKKKLNYYNIFKFNCKKTFIFQEFFLLQLNQLWIKYEVCILCTDFIQIWKMYAFILLLVMKYLVLKIRHVSTLQLFISYKCYLYYIVMLKFWCNFDVL